MSLLIKGMEMPKNCGDCWFEYAYEFCESKYEDCPLIELPPHGRLIDADAAAKQGWTISRTYSASPTEMVYEVKTMIDEVLPTIIPAEEGE